MKKKKFKFPKRSLLLYLLLLIVPVFVFFLIYIPVSYKNYYDKHKVTPFSSEVSELENSGLKVIKGDKDTIKDFNFLIYCTTYNDRSGKYDKNLKEKDEQSSAEFKALAWRNDSTDALNIGNSLEYDIELADDWLGFQKSGSIRTARKVANSVNEAMGSSSYYATFSIKNLPNLPKAADIPFVTVNSLKLYVHVKYTTKVNGTETQKHYILEYKYEDYIIGQKVYDQGTDIEYTISPTRGGVAK